MAPKSKHKKVRKSRAKAKVSVVIEVAASTPEYGAPELTPEEQAAAYSAEGDPRPQAALDDTAEFDIAQAAAFPEPRGICGIYGVSGLLTFAAIIALLGAAVYFSVR
jgi:hypothetical protein